MVMGVVTNVASFDVARTLGRTNAAMTRSLERLSSGYRINRAADDAAGLCIAQGLRAQVGGMTQALRNTQDGISVVQTADGALGEAQAVLHRMRDLAVQAANDGGLTAPAKAAIQKEVDQLKAQLTTIASTTTFGGQKLLDGSYRGTFQVGADAGQTITLAIGGMGAGIDPAGLGIGAVDVAGSGSTVATTVTPAVSAAQGTPAAGEIVFAGDYVTPGVYQTTYANLKGTLTYAGKSLDLGTIDYTGAVTSTDYLSKLTAPAMPLFGTVHTPFVGTALGLSFTGDTPAAGSTVADGQLLTPSYTGKSGAAGALGLLDSAVDSISSLRAYLGAVQNRFEHTAARLGGALSDTTASLSRIEDTDMAAEMSNLSRSQVLTQAGTAMLAQAGQAPQSLLKLLAA
jgi:flagellin